MEDVTLVEVVRSLIDYPQNQKLLITLFPVLNFLLLCEVEVQPEGKTDSCLSCSKCYATGMAVRPRCVHGERPRSNAVSGQAGRVVERVHFRPTSKNSSQPFQETRDFDMSGNLVKFRRNSATPGKIS